MSIFQIEVACSDHLRFARHWLRNDLSRSCPGIRAGHIAECVAAGFGFRSSIAMLAELDAPEHDIYLPLTFDVDAARGRLVALGHPNAKDIGSQRFGDAIGFLLFMWRNSVAEGTTDVNPPEFLEEWYSDRMERIRTQRGRLCGTPADDARLLAQQIDLSMFSNYRSEGVVYDGESRRRAVYTFTMMVSVAPGLLRKLRTGETDVPTAVSWWHDWGRRMHEARFAADKAIARGVLARAAVPAWPAEINEAFLTELDRLAKGRGPDNELPVCRDCLQPERCRGEAQCHYTKTDMLGPGLEQAEWWPPSYRAGEKP